MRALLIVILYFVSVALVGAETTSQETLEKESILENAAKSGTIASRLSEPEEIKALLGDPDEEKTIDRRDRIFMEYGDLHISFYKYKNSEVPFVLFKAGHKVGQEVDLGQDRLLKLKSKEDLKKLDSFRGLSNVSLATINMKDQADY